MKKLFLLILAGGMMMTACKKEENLKNEIKQPKPWKTSDWVLTKKSVIIEGILCDEYVNQKTGQVVYEAKEEEKQVTFNMTPYLIDDFGHLDCKAPGSTCFKGIIDGQRVLIIKVGASAH